MAVATSNADKGISKDKKLGTGMKNGVETFETQTKKSVRNKLPGYLQVVADNAAAQDALTEKLFTPKTSYKADPSIRKADFNTFLGDVLTKLGASKQPAPELTDTYIDPYAGARAALTSQGSANDARLEAMYRQVADYIAGQKGDTEAIYNKAAQDYQAGTNTAVNTVNAGYGTAREQLTNALNALGIQDAAKTILARNEDMSGQQTASTTALANILSSNLNRNTAAQTGALSNLVNMSSATMGEGARARSAYQQAVANQLAQLDVQSATARNTYDRELASSLADAEAAAAKAASGTKASISSDQYMTEYTNAYNKFKEQNYTDEAARSAAESYMKAWYGNKAIS